MSNEIDQALIGILDKAGSNVGKGLDFILSELPDLVSQLILSNTVLLSIGVLNSLLFILLTIFLWVKLHFSIKSKVSWSFLTEADRSGVVELSGTGVPVMVASTLAGIMGFIALCIWARSLILITLAPKVWVLEYLLHLK
jgi:hypothetical protein